MKYENYTVVCEKKNNDIHRRLYERNRTYINRRDSVKNHNKFMSEIEGKKISFKRINQAFKMYYYGGSTWKGAPPLFYNTTILNIDIENKIVTLCLGLNYRNVDDWIETKKEKMEIKGEQ